MLTLFPYTVGPTSQHSQAFNTQTASGWHCSGFLQIPKTATLLLLKQVSCENSNEILEDRRGKTQARADDYTKCDVQLAEQMKPLLTEQGDAYLKNCKCLERTDKIETWSISYWKYESFTSVEAVWHSFIIRYRTQCCLCLYLITPTVCVLFTVKNYEVCLLKECFSVKCLSYEERKKEIVSFRSGYEQYIPFIFYCTLYCSGYRVKTHPDSHWWCC